MSERTRNVIVGLTTLVALASLAVLLLLFGAVPQAIANRYTVTFHLEQAGGLTEGSRIRLSGIDVGQVERVDFGASVNEVVAIGSVRPEIEIPAAIDATVETQIFGGGPYLSLRVDPENEREGMLARDGSAEVEARVPSLDGRLTAGLKTVIEQPLDRVDRFVESFEALSENWTRVGANVATLTRPDAGDETAAGPSVAGVMRRADRRLEELREVLDGLDEWVNDQQMREDARAAVANARSMTESGRERIEQVGDRVDTLAKRYAKVADELSAAMTGVRQLVEKANEGEGSAGRLLNDPSLYENLDDASERVVEALRELKLLILKWKAEGVPVQF